jgi:peptidylprolyl isomerase
MIKLHISLIAVVSSVVLIAGCTKPNSNLVLNDGDTIKVDYVGTFSDGTVFDTSIESKAKQAGIYQAGRPYQPLEVTLGKGMVVPGFEKGIKSLTYTWQTKNISLTPEEGYGPSDPKKIAQIPMEVFKKAGVTPQVWEQKIQNMPIKVVAISGDVVTVDANHPMAGKTLNFEITLREVQKGSTSSTK